MLPYRSQLSPYIQGAVVTEALTVCRWTEMNSCGYRSCVKCTIQTSVVPFKSFIFAKWASAREAQAFPAFSATSSADGTP